MLTNHFLLQVSCELIRPSRSGGCIEKMTSSLAATVFGETAPSPLNDASMVSHTPLISTLPWLVRQRCSGSTRLIVRSTASIET